MSDQIARFAQSVISARPAERSGPKGQTGPPLAPWGAGGPAAARFPAESRIALRPLSPPVPFVEYDESEAICPQCGSAFRSPEVLEAHVQESHAAPGSAPTKVAGKSVRCSVCSARLSSIAALQRHNREAHVG